MERGTTYGDLDLWPLADVVSAAVAVQARALDGVKAAGPALVKAIDALAGLLRAGGRMAYAGAGSSGVLAQLDALEMPGTFGIPLDRVPVILAGRPGSSAGDPLGRRGRPRGRDRGRRPARRRSRRRLRGDRGEWRHALHRGGPGARPGQAVP